MVGYRWRWHWKQFNVDDDNDNVLDEDDCAPLDNTSFVIVNAYLDSNNDTFANSLIGEEFCTDGTAPNGYTLRAGSYSKFSTNEDTLKSFRETDFTDILDDFEKIRTTELPTKGDLKLEIVL